MATQKLSLLRAIVLALPALVTGCNEYTSVPPTIMDEARGLCATMEGVKTLDIATYVKNPKLLDGVMISDIRVRCVRHNAIITKTFQWQYPQI